jgi:hypothetical protein
MMLSWHKCPREAWCGLNSLDLDDHRLDGLHGVYAIWHGGQQPAAVKVGHGLIRECIRAARNDNNVQAHLESGLFVTWAALGAAYRDGVAAYLELMLQPIVRDRFGSPPVPVNLPW